MITPNNNSFILSGLKSVMVTFTQRPQSILNLYYLREKGRSVLPLTSYLANVKRPFNEVSEEDLKKICGGTQHEGIAAKILPVPVHTFSGKDLEGRSLIVVFDGVSNPHNYGAIIRTLSFLGVSDLLQSDNAIQAKPSGSAMRVAEGGFEFIKIWRGNLVTSLKDLKTRGYQIVGANSPDFPGVVPLPNAFPSLMSPTVLVVGNEVKGISPEVRAVCDYQLTIPGTGKVESLNVSVATGILVSAFLMNRLKK